uniref:D-alanyl-D-alanine carboxypeptidase family protein n=1 Tax=Ancylobacter sonchi TaxID=1937790 RepID=UPI0035E44400
MNPSSRRTRNRAIILALAGALAALMPLAGSTAARATPSLVVDMDSGKVLLAEDATKPWYPASITKLMTAYVTFRAMKAGRLTENTLITVSPLAASQAPSKMGFVPGTKLTVDNALKMMLVKSANDMAYVLAEGVSGSLPAFVDEMNEAARDLGMTGSHFANPNGLPDPNNVTTARDLAVLVRAIALEYPEHEQLFRIPAMKVGNNVIRSYNKLIDRYPGADGMKTGFICASGFNLVATAHRGDKRLIAIVLGTNSGKERTEQAALLLERGFNQSWQIFGAVAPTVDSLRNQGGAPTDMRAQVCGAKRKTVASEADDDSGPAPAGFAAAGMVSLGANVTGASLLQNLPPSMPPVEVFVGPTPDAAALAAAYPAPAPKKPATGSKKVTGAKQVAIPVTPAKPDSKSGSKTAAKPKSTPETTVMADPTGDTAPAPKPAAKPTAQPAAKPAPKPTASTAKPKPAAKPAAQTGSQPTIIVAPVPAPGASTAAQ